MQNRLLFCSIGCPVQAACSVFRFYTPNLPFIRLYFKYLNNKISIYYIFIIKCKYKLQASLTLQETQSIHDSMIIPKIKLIKIVGERR